MSQEQSLTIDFNQRDTLLSVLPCLPLASSHAAGWDKIQLAHYRQPAYSVPKHCSLQHIICTDVGKPIVFQLAVLYAEWWYELNLLEVMKQLGMVFN